MNASRNLMVTGARGFVASSVIAQALSDWEVHAVSRGFPTVEHPRLKWHTLDSFDKSSLTRLFDLVRPQAVIHTAALANIDICEANPALAHEANTVLTTLIAELADKYKAKVVFCSTDNVFDGAHAPYKEHDEAFPVNVYGKTKLIAERAVIAMGKHAVVARLAFVIGFPLLGKAESFMTKVVKAIVSGQPFCAPDDEYRTPIDVVTAGRALLELVEELHFGIIHLAGNDRLNRFQLLMEIANMLGQPATGIIRVEPGALKSRAPRPKDVSLDNTKARNTLKTPMLGVRDGLALILDRTPARRKLLE